MPRPLGPAFRPAAARDALGLVHLLFALERDGIDVTRAADLVEIGRTLAECLKMGIDMADRQETLGYRAAVGRGADAADKLAAMKWSAKIAELVRAAQARVKGNQPRREDAQGAKRAAVARRG